MNVEGKGNLTRDIEMQYTKNGKQYCNFSIAENYKDEVSFFDVTAWGDVAKSCEGLKKGNKVYIEGFLKQDRFEYRGAQHSKVKIVAQLVQLNQGTRAPQGPAQNLKENNTDDIPF